MVSESCGKPWEEKDMIKFGKIIGCLDLDMIWKVHALNLPE